MSVHPVRRTGILDCNVDQQLTFLATNISYDYHNADQKPLVVPPQLETVERAFCYLDILNTQRHWFPHFPHTAQAIYACWSFFEQVREQFPRAKMGFWLNNQLITSPPRIRFRFAWVNALVPQLQTCTYYRNMPLEAFSPQNNQSLGIMPEAKALVYRLPNRVKDN